MLSLAHTLISLPFAIIFQNPILIFTGAALSHLLADTLLHWNIYPYNFKRYPFELVTLDILGGLALAYLVLGTDLLAAPFIIAIAGGNAPDVAHGLWELLSLKTRRQAPRVIQTLFRTHDNLQLETKKPLPGLVSQIIAVITAISLTLILK